MKKICPIRVTRKFRCAIQERFFVPNYARTLESIRQQLISGNYEKLGSAEYQVQIRDIPARLVMIDGVLVTVREMGMVD